MNKYWENETPVMVHTGKNVLRYFKEAGKLQIAQPNWTDKDGQERPGKSVTLDVDALHETPEAVTLIQEIMEV